MRTTRGFTLIEIMIALAVFATVAMALVRSASLSVDQARQVAEMTEARWLAENHIAALRITPREPGSLPAQGVDREQLYSAGREWELVAEISDTDNPYVQRVEVQIFKSADMDQPVYTLIGFLGKH